MTATESGRRLEQEALRLCDRYVSEIVLGFGLCPWAEPALRTGRVARAVCLSPRPTPDECLPFIDHFAAASDPPLDIGIMVFPACTDAWAAFDAFAERVRRVQRDRGATAGPAGAAGPTNYLVATFHPDGAQTFTSAHQLVSFLRRTPDPTLQFVRAEVIDRLNATQPHASQEVGTRNYQALVTADPPPALPGARRLAIDAALRAIHLDREETYARLRARGG